MTVNGRSYVGTVGVYQTVPFADGLILIGNGWMTNCARGCGPTTARPPVGGIDVQSGMQGASFFDTSLGVLIAWDGANWRSSATGAIV